jgi:hypothetical protein
MIYISNSKMMPSSSHFLGIKNERVDLKSHFLGIMSHLLCIKNHSSGIKSGWSGIINQTTYLMSHLLCIINQFLGIKSQFIYLKSLWETSEMFDKSLKIQD